MWGDSPVHCGLTLSLILVLKLTLIAGLSLIPIPPPARPVRNAARLLSRKRQLRFRRITLIIPAKPVAMKPIAPGSGTDVAMNSP